jgi:hypothetical protein
VCGIYLAIQKWEASDNSIIESMSAAMKEKFMKYWMDVHGLMAVATVLDPRRKMKFLYAMYTQIYGPEDMFGEVKKIKDLLIDLVKEFEGSMKGFGATYGIVAGGSSKKELNEGDAEVNEIFDKYWLLNKLCRHLLCAQNWICTWKRICCQEPLNWMSLIGGKLEG